MPDWDSDLRTSLSLSPRSSYKYFAYHDPYDSSTGRYSGYVSQGNAGWMWTGRWKTADGSKTYSCAEPIVVSFSEIDSSWPTSPNGLYVYLDLYAEFTEVTGLPLRTDTAPYSPARAQGGDPLRDGDAGA